MAGRQPLSWIGRHEVGTFTTVLAVVLLVWGFVAITEAVTTGATSDLDNYVLEAMRSPGDPSDPIGAGWAEELGRDVTALGGVAVLTLLTVGVVVALLLYRRSGTALSVLFAVGGGLGLSLLLKGVIARPRPELTADSVHVYTASFPSGHSMMAAVTYLTLAALLLRLETRAQVRAYIVLLAVLITVGVGFSRIYLGVHYLTDVVAGIALGTAWGLLVLVVAGRWEARRARPP